MTGRIEKTVFISYRRANKPWALFIYQNLTHHGYDVFIDFQNINSGNFETAILDNIRARAHFIVVLTPSALERCKEPADWLRKEIEAALDEKRNIIPLMVEGFDFGSEAVKSALTGKLSVLSSINGLRIPDEYPFEAMDRLRERYLNITLSNVVLPKLPEEAQEITSIQKSIANMTPPITEEQLTAQTWFERGFVYQQSSNFNEAIRCYVESIRLLPNASAPHNNLGIVLHEMNRDLEAEVEYQKALELDPMDFTAYSNLGNLLVFKKEYDKAETLFRKAIELAPKNSIPYANLGLLLHEHLDRLIEAEIILKKSIELNPLNPDAYYNLGNLLRDEKVRRYPEAEAAYRKAIAISPTYAKAYGNLGNALIELNREEEAENAYLKAIELDPKFSTAYFNLGTLLKDQKKYVEAEMFLRKAIEYNPRYVKALNNLGLLLSDLNRDKEAESFTRKAVEIEISNPISLNNLGTILVKMNRVQEAEEEFRKAIEFDPTFQTAYTNLMIILRKDKRLEEILDLLRKAIEINPSDFNVFLELASVNKQLGNSVYKNYIEKARQSIHEDNWYDRACLESISDNLDLAIEYLQKAKESNNFDSKWAMEDPDLQWIRDDSRFLKIVDTDALL